ncbi:MAG: sulfotransferase [Cyanobacteria bacterium P01_H01_bin.121]
MSIQFSRAAALMQHFFVVGCPRSGTTLLQTCIIANPAIAGIGETFFFRRSEPAERVRDFLWKLDRYAQRRGATAWCEKSPYHALQMPRIRFYSPGARFIFISRPKVETVPRILRMMQQLQPGNKIWTEATCDRLWETYRHVYNRYRQAPWVCSVEYADLVGDTDRTLARVGEFIGYELNAYQDRRAIAAQSVIRQRETHKHRVFQSIQPQPVIDPDITFQP